jgi:hypothetical protein
LGAGNPHALATALDSSATAVKMTKRRLTTQAGLYR